MRKTKPQAYREFTLSDGTRLVAKADALQGGAAELYRPARHVKPEQQGFLTGLLNKFLSIFKSHDKNTTEQGASSASSPSSFGLALYQERQERREKIADCRLIAQYEPRARRSTLKFAREAVRKGVTISLSDNNKLSSEQQLIAEQICSDVQKVVKKKLTSWAWMLSVEGDLFVQAIISGKQIVGAKRMPAVAMERVTDDTDEFIDKQHAFVQLDTQTNETIATFNAAIMFHQRWNHIDGERYGESEIIAARRLKGLLELQEEAQAVRRMTRATNRTLWNIMGAEGVYGSEAEVLAFRDANGFIQGEREIFDPQETARDFVGNGGVKMETLPADSGVSDVADLKYLQNIYASASLPTPPPLYNLDAEAVNRDVLEDLRAEYLNESTVLSDAIIEVVRWLVDLALLLNGILPERVDYSCRTSESSIEKPSEIVSRVIELRKNASADFQPDPLVTRKKCLELLSEIIDVSDPAAFLKELEKEKEQDAANKLKQVQEQTQMQTELQIQSQQAMQAAGLADPADSTDKPDSAPTPASGTQPPNAANSASPDIHGLLKEHQAGK